MNKNFRFEIFKKASLCRNFEEQVIVNVNNKNITTPVYVSAGQEFIASTISAICKKNKIKPLIFAQHRCHSTYLAFGGNIIELIDELLGRESGCTKGKGGSASINSKAINMFGHDGLMGSNGPVGVGACFATKKPTIIFLGDAAAEEDYVLGALGWASYKKLPILFVIEDNNFSILTKKNVRRNWNMKDVARSFKLVGHDIKDDPKEIEKHSKIFFKRPMLLNINTNRIYWHAGGGMDNNKTFDRFNSEKKILGVQAVKINEYYKTNIKKLWKLQLEKQ
jgi:TPP-dependent pyruvate/acetoin dehydrogenase alpha subunit